MLPGKKRAAFANRNEATFEFRGRISSRRKMPRLMHELSIMESALNQVLDEARKAGARRVSEIRLRIGALSGVVPEALQFAFDALRTGTAADAATLTIESVPAKFWCGICQTEFESPNAIGECPLCKNFTGELRAGRELDLASMEVI